MVVLISFLIIVLVILVIVQISKVVEYTADIKGRERYEKEAYNANAALLLVFLAVFFIGIGVYHFSALDTLLPRAASAHGHMVDNMFKWVLFFTFIVFVATQIALFWFAFKYRKQEGRKGVHYSHNNTLELWWTLIPAVTMSGLVIYGLTTWMEITGAPGEDHEVVEVWGQQFFWTVHYAGEDMTMGETDLLLVSANNSLGLVANPFIEDKRLSLEEDTAKFRVQIKENKAMITAYESFISDPFNRQFEDEWDMAEDAIDSLEDVLDDLDHSIEASTRRLENIIIKYYDENDKLTAEMVNPAMDDFIPTKLVLKKNQEYLFHIHAFDVLHSFALPHFRVKMDAVPGIPTRFKMTPIYTTAEMQDITGNPDFKYELACQELCGTGHNSMQMEVIVLEEEEYNTWAKEQQSYFSLVEGALKSREMKPTTAALEVEADTVEVAEPETN